MSAPDQRAARVEEDVVSRFTFWGTAAVAVVVTVVFSLVARGLLHTWSSDRDASRARSAARAPAQIGIVEQTLTTSTKRGLDENARQRESLGRYGWVDPERGVAQIPIDEAMRLVTDRDLLQRALGRDGGL